VKLDLPVMLMMLVTAAALQTLLPPLPLCLLKPPLLPAVALYYALRRQPQRSLVAALWAGILTDGLGGVPAGTSAFVLLAVALLLLALRQVLPGESWTTAALAGAAVAPLLAGAQALALRRQWECAPGPATLLVTLLVLAAAGALLTAAAAAAGRGLDLWAGNVKTREEIENREG
jgi:rod shape-determining protein MreD